MEKLYDSSETGCCPRFNPAPWDEKQVVFKDKLFLKAHYSSFLHIPIGFGKLMVKNMELIQKAGALSPEPLMLCDEKSVWGADVFIAVTKNVPGANMEKISGTFLSKVFEGNYDSMGKWVQEMQSFVQSKGKIAQKLYFFYTACPKCAKHYGKNYVVILARV
ncbi:MAG: hydrolase [Candidatus Diapherotrites archaeon]